VGAGGGECIVGWGAGLKGRGGGSEGMRTTTAGEVRFV